MSTLTPVSPTADQARAERRGDVPPIPLPTVTAVELRKMFDTRSGFWLMSSIGILSVLATGAVILFAPDDALAYGNFAAAIGFPMAVVLPMIAILSVTGEWSQRSGLTTFTLVPNRGRVVLAKAIAAVGVAIVSMVIAMVVGALGNVIGSNIAGVPTVWNATATDLLYIVLANVLGLLMGFTLGVLIRNSAGAIVAYFVYSLLLPTVAGMLAATQEWFADLRVWVDFQNNQSLLFDAGFTGEQWAQLAVTAVLWMVLPMAFGVWRVLRSEVK
jgi:ABC-2 type transport system permease protein